MPGDALYVHYGCGLCAPDGWCNFDASPRLRLEQLFIPRALRTALGIFPANVKFGDIVSGLPVAEGSAQGVYCSHVLEHLPREDVPAALQNTLGMLKPGGLFRLVVPDLQWRTAQYARAAALGDSAAADAFMESCLLGTRQGAKRLAARLRHRFSKNAHLWMYDFGALKGLLKAAGFTGVRRCEIGDSSDSMFALVEDAGRFFESGERELAIEAERPLF